MSGSDTSVIVALISAMVSVLVALLALVRALLNQRQVERSQRDLLVLRAEIAEQQAERGARRDYEYEARKSLYQHFEPLRFQLLK